MSRAEGFAAVPNWMIRDKRVPRNAILVYASLSSRAGMGAIFPSQSTIATEAGLSERTVRTMLAKLEEFGVIERRARRGGEGRQTGKTDAYTLHPNGHDEEPANIAGRSKRAAIEEQATGNQAHLVPLIEVDREEVERGPSFDDFYQVYPRKVAKENARRAFAAACKKASAADIVAGARRFAADPNLPAEKQWIPHPTSWLNAGRWDDEALPPRIDKAAPAAALRSDDFEPGEEWAAWGR